MSDIKPEQIKLLREKTGAGIMDCKVALLENSGDMERSITWLRKKGISSANKKISRTAAEGLVGIKISNNTACMIEVNAETDFVSKNKDFQDFIFNLLSVAAKKEIKVDELILERYNETITVEDSLKNLISKVGENIVIRRLQYLIKESDDCFFSSYTHNEVNNDLGKIGSLILVRSNKENEKAKDLARKISMHIAATRPLALKKEDLDLDIVEKERNIIKEQLLESGKPENIVDKIVHGKISKFLSENALLEQDWVMDTSVKVKQVIESFEKQEGLKFEIADYSFFVLGDGIDVVEKNFKEEVESQI